MVKSLQAGVKVQRSVLRVGWLRVRHIKSMVKVRENLLVEVSILKCFKVEWLRLGIKVAWLVLDNIAQFFHTLL